MNRLLLASWRSLVLFWTEPIRAEPLAVYRILLAAVILLSQLTGFVRHLSTMCGDDPLLPAETRDAWLTKSGRICLLRGPINLPFLGEWLPDKIFGDHLRPERNRLQNWISDDSAKAWADWGAKPSSVYSLYAVYLVVLVCVMVGFRTRLMTFAAVLLAATFNNRMVELINGGDSLFRNGLYFLLLSPAGAMWSVDAWMKRREKTIPVMIEPWSVRLIQIQLAIMYLFIGLTKLNDIRPDAVYGWWWPRGDWLDGVALYWVLNDVALTRWSYAQFAVPMVVCKLLTWGTLFFELFFSILVAIRPIRPFIVLAGLGLHLGILLTMEIGWFSQVSMCFYALLIPGEKWVAFANRILRTRTGDMGK